jgi:hypothetical protein
MVMTLMVSPYLHDRQIFMTASLPADAGNS